ncbi:hypothetical protein Hypma_010469 [Hypsizygus marmoreus]|uniref:BTB domain-containing protein n=1 Tax=Hypsizygus marmoreus TaxID=39966 RepID=A0A369JPS8_HYPMA|nr:hypothetical protein Hypma_010469 [Hypsizygus marmoreus]
MWKHPLFCSAWCMGLLSWLLLVALRTVLHEGSCFGPTDTHAPRLACLGHLMATCDVSVDFVAQWKSPARYKDCAYFHDTEVREKSWTNDWLIEQTATPAVSPSSVIVAEDPPSAITISRAFQPASHHKPYDVVLSSLDTVLFYVHSDILLRTSDNGFSSLLSAPCTSTAIDISEMSAVLDALLHVLYSEPCAEKPTFQTLVIAVDHMRYYGLEPRQHLTSSNPMYGYLLGFAPLFPLDLYALAARYDIFELAASTSSHLLRYSLPTISDEMADRIGAVYLNRLFHLLVRRSEALKSILLRSPYPHHPTPRCNFEAQKQMNRAWSLGVAQLVWEARPDIPANEIESAFSPLAIPITCELCRQSLADRMKEVVTLWASVDRTISP